VRRTGISIFLFFEWQTPLQTPVGIIHTVALELDVPVFVRNTVFIVLILIMEVFFAYCAILRFIESMLICRQEQARLVLQNASDAVLYHTSDYRTVWSSLWPLWASSRRPHGLALAHYRY
jgi:hypothetical protein